MFRALIIVVIIALLPLISSAEEGVELKTENAGQVVVVSINMKSGKVKISILNAGKEDKEEKQQNEDELISDKKHSRRRGK